MIVKPDQIVGLLKASTEFGFLQDHILQDLAAHLEIQEFTSGTRIVSEGKRTNSMFVLISGRLRVSRQQIQGKSLLLYNEILPGECVGELDMILGQARTADITAIRSSVIGVLSRESFETLLEKYPIELNKTFSQAIYNHLRHSRRVQKQKRAHSIAVIPLSPDIDTPRVCRNLTRAFAGRGKSRHIVLNQFTAEEQIQIDNLEADNDFIVYETGYKISPKTIAGYQNADQILFIVKARQSRQLSPIETALASQPGFELIRKHLIVLHDRKTPFCQDRLSWETSRDVERVYPATLDDMSDYQGIARFLTGSAVGVVLGGGGAKGFAHLGVLRAFKEKGIPVDLLGGNSMGALIGACVAFGMPLDHIHHEILRFVNGAVKLSLPVVSILSNDNFENALGQIFGDIRIQTLWLPYFAGACNLSQASTQIMDTGSLIKAVLASNSPAGLLPPVIQKGQLLVDGAILENVPVNAMRSRLGTKLERRRGNGTIIAIDVDVKDNFEVDENIRALKKWPVIKSHFNARQKTLPGLKEILAHSSLIGGLAQRRRITCAADYYMEPPVSQFSMTAFKEAERIIDVGYQFAMKQIDEWDLQL